MKTKKEHVLYDNYDIDGYMETVKEDYEEDEVSDEFLYETVNELLYEDWLQLMEDIEEVFGDRLAIAVGTVGLWTGTHAGGKVDKVKNLIMSLMTDCDYAKIVDEDGHLYITCSHHDGTHHMEIKMLTEKGEKAFDNWNYDPYNCKTLQEEHNTLFTNNFFSSLPRVWEKAYNTF